MHTYVWIGGAWSIGREKMMKKLYRMYKDDDE
jgi:hypothetical protein